MSKKENNKWRQIWPTYLFHIQKILIGRIVTVVGCNNMYSIWLHHYKFFKFLKRVMTFCVIKPRRRIYVHSTDTDILVLQNVLIRFSTALCFLILNQHLEQSPVILFTCLHIRHQNSLYLYFRKKVYNTKILIFILRYFLKTKNHFWHVRHQNLLYLYFPKKKKYV